MKKITQVCVLAIFAILAAGQSNAQSNYQKGKVVTTEGEVLNGFIDYREWDRNPISFKFKTTLEAANERSFVPKEVTSFEVEHMDYFETDMVDISLGKMATADQVERRVDTATRRALVFLRVIKKGSVVTLFSFTDNIKTRYYIKEQIKSGAPVELLVRSHVSTTNDSRIITDEIYKAQLFKIVNEHKNINTDALLPVIQKLRYTLPSIAKIVDAINGPDTRALPKLPKSRIQFYAGANIFATTARYKGRNELSSDANSKVSILPGLSAGVDIFTNSYVKRVRLRIDISFSPARYEIFKSMDDVGGYVKHNFDRYSIGFSPQVIYNFYNSNKLSLNAGAGLTTSYSISSNNIYEMKYGSYGPGTIYDYKTETNLQPFGFSVPVRIGVMIGKRFDIYAQYNIPISDITAYDFYSIRVRSGKVGVNLML